jgi:ABC-type lipoprotein export system ATPase subunit
MGTLDRPTTGRVLLEDRDLTKLDEIELARIRNQEIGFVFQLHHLLPQCTVLENVLVPTIVGEGRSRRQEVERRAIDLLQRVGIEDNLLYRPGELSGGQRQRVAVVRALVNQPKLLLADEPTGSLDEETSQKIAELLVELNRSEGVTLIVVTHSLVLAERMGQVMELRGGLLKRRGR